MNTFTSKRRGGSSWSSVIWAGAAYMRAAGSRTRVAARHRGSAVHAVRVSSTARIGACGLRGLPQRLHMPSIKVKRPPSLIRAPGCATAVAPLGVRASGSSDARVVEGQDSGDHGGEQRHRPRDRRAVRRRRRQRGPDRARPGSTRPGGRRDHCEGWQGDRSWPIRLRPRRPGKFSPRRWRRCGSSSGLPAAINPADLVYPCTRVAGGAIFSYLTEPGELQRRSRAVLDAITDGWLNVPQGPGYTFARAAEAHADIERRRTHGKLFLHS
jgi:hypothetical protein